MVSSLYDYRYRPSIREYCFGNIWGKPYSDATKLFRELIIDIETKRACT